MQIKDIARLAGVAPSTVSRVLNNSGYVSEEVRQRVEQMIEKTGYQPNIIAKSLKNKKSCTIGVIVPQIASESVACVVEAISVVCEAKGYQIILSNSMLKNENEALCLKSLVRRQIDGVIIMSSGVTSKLSEQIRQLPIPAIVIGQQSEEVFCISHDDVEASCALVDRLIQKGASRVAMLNVQTDDDAIRNKRAQGYLKALEKNGLRFDRSLLAYGDYSIHSGYEMMQQVWLASGQKPDAVFAVIDKIAIGALQYLKDCGILVPQECMVAGIGNNKLSQFAQPPLTSVDYGYNALGTTAANMLLETIESGGRLQGIYYMPYEIVERGSTR